MGSVSEKTVFISSEKSGSREFVTVTDKETGEVISQYWKQTKSGGYTPPVQGKQPNFYKLYATNWQDIIQKKRLSFNEVGLFVSLLSFLDWESPYVVHPETGKPLSCYAIAKLLQCDRKHIETILERLCDKGMVAKVNRGYGYSCHYMLNSNVVHFGKYMRDLNDHNNFSNCPYKPPVEVKYRESKKK